LRLPTFEYLEPKNLEEALELSAKHADQATVLAGGTDLIVRMQQRLVEPAFLISLKDLNDLNYIRQENGLTVIGATTPLASILDSELIKTHFPALSQAALLIGAPPIQHFRGTIGGNLCLQTRCLYYNQSAFWRSGRTRCHKDHGETCYAEEGSDRCRSANQSDGACALMALGAKIVLRSIRGKRTLPIEEFFTGKGEAPFAMDSNELVTEIQLSVPGTGQGSSFQKLTYRSAIDFALVSAAAGLAVEEGKISEARIAVGGAGASPLLLKEAANTLIGKDHQDMDAVKKTAEQVKKHASAFMVHNLGSTLEYRQKMSEVMARRAIKEALDRCIGNSVAPRKAK
jgi:4-hydroxybenzoyl-CoA reductase beta subunit